MNAPGPVATHSAWVKEYVDDLSSTLNALALDSDRLEPHERISVAEASSMLQTLHGAFIASERERLLLRDALARSPAIGRA